MPFISVNNRPIEVTDIEKLSRQDVGRKIRSAPGNGKDEIFFIANRDTFVASGKKLDLGIVSTGDPVLFNGLKGVIVSVDKEGPAASPGIIRKAALTAEVMAAMVGIAAVEELLDEF